MSNDSMTWRVLAIVLHKMGELARFVIQGLGVNPNAKKPSLEARTHNGEAHDEPPKASHGVAFDRLPHSHLMLAILAIKSTAHEIRVDQDLRMINILLLEVLNFDLIAVVQIILMVGHA